jgi:hypothetical protein
MPVREITKSDLACQGDFGTKYCVETGVDDGSSWDFSAGKVHFGEGVPDFGDSVSPEGYLDA